MAKEKIFGHCRACHITCPAYYEVEDGRLLSILPVPPSEGGPGVICGRGIGASLQLLHSPTRVRYPLKRAGKRGEGKWERISWDQATEEIAEKIVDMSKKYGPETFVLPGRTGRQDMGWIAHKVARTIGTPNNYYGVTQVCLLPQMHSHITYGSMMQAPFVPSPESALFIQTGCETPYSWPVVDAAALPLDTSRPTIVLDPVAGVRAMRATEWLPVRPGTDLAFFMCALRHLIETESYDVDFVKQWTNAPFLVRDDNGELLMESDLVAGGSDKRYLFWDAVSDSIKYWDALEIQWEGGASGKEHYHKCEENFWQEKISTEHSPAVKPENLDPALFGVHEVHLARGGALVTCKPAFQLLAESVSEMTPKKASEITWIPEEQLERCNKMIEELRPLELWEATQQMSTNTSQLLNAINLCRILTKSVEENQLTSLTQFYPVTPQSFPGEYDISYAEGLPLDQKRKRLGYYEHRIACGFAWDEWVKWHPMRPENADATLNIPDIGAVLRAAETGYPYEVHGIIAISSNWLMHDPATARWLKLIEDEDKIQLHVVSELVMTPTAELADYVLPAVTWMERNYLEFATSGAVYARNAFSKAVEPICEARHDYDFGALLAKKLEAIDPRYNNDLLLNPPNSLFWAGEIGKLWENDTIDEERGRWCEQFALKSWEESLKETKVTYETAGMPESFQRYLVSGNFPTDSGKINLYSVLHQKSGYPAVPEYIEPYESPYSRPDLAEEYPLVLSTGKRQGGFFHSEFRQIPWIRETNPTPEVFMDPGTAKEYGVDHGDWVWVESPPTCGRAPLNKVMGRISFRFITRPGVLIYSQHGWWRPERSATEDFHGALEWNCESLLETDHVAPETGTAGLRSQLCKVYKCTDEEIEHYRPIITREELEGLMPGAKEEM